MDSRTTPDAWGELIEPTTLKIQRLLPGPVERIWAYLTDSELRRKWLAAGEMEMKTGAPFELVWRNSELNDPPERAAGGLLRRAPDAEPDHRTRSAAQAFIRMEQQRRRYVRTGAEGRKVLLTVTHRRLPDRSTMLKVSAGWHMHLDVLVARAAATSRRRSGKAGAACTRNMTGGSRPEAASRPGRATSIASKQEVSHENSCRFGAGVGSRAPAAARKEKAMTRARDALAAERRRMPWMAVEKTYQFDGPNGQSEPARPVRRPPSADRLPRLLRARRARLAGACLRRLLHGGRPGRPSRPSERARHHARVRLARAAGRHRAPEGANGLGDALVHHHRQLRRRLRRGRMARPQRVHPRRRQGVPHLLHQQPRRRGDGDAPGATST